METKQISKLEFLSGGGECGEMLRTTDWSRTPLGAPENWPQSLKTCVRIILTSSQPMFVWWGKDLINIYNDSYKAIVGGKHPGSFGAPAYEVWKEIWNEVGPRAETVMTQNIGTYDEALLLIMERNGYPEETYYTFSYSPIPADTGGVGGIICANTNNTDHIINERSIHTLRDIASMPYSEMTVESVYKNAARILHQNTKDFPFAIFFKVDEDLKSAEAVAWAGDKKAYNDFPLKADLTNPVEGTRNLCQAIETSQLQLVKNEGRRTNIPKGFWDIIPSEFLHIPISHPNKDKPLAVLTIGLNPYRQFNETYRNFIKLVADQISLVVSNVLAYEEERKRVEALEEIDKAKTHFFSNISHEFRTPLTLILGPLENLLNASTLSTQEDNNLKSAHRNTLRLLRLVNMLLEFSRIEAGRLEARYEPVDLSSFTSDLAGAFRSTIENAGMKFNVTLNKSEEPVYIDREMWEKIVLNLISNAFKYTLSGEINVSLQHIENVAELKISDTGIGIPEKELPRMFERFHRVQNSQGRSYEGTGIGLSLVYELIKMHSGSISVESKEGKGSTFTVRIPYGSDHLPEQHIIKENRDYMASSLINSFINDAAVSGETKNPQANFPIGVGTLQDKSKNKNDKEQTKILVVDDNADMRDYIQNLLITDFAVETAVNGKDALEKIAKEKPDLILSDIMMPVMDGNQLLESLKKSSATANIPVIFLSARAGDEAKTEGLQAGADDYLVKPFSSKEIIARVKAQIKLSQARLHVNQQLYNLFVQAPIAMCIFKGKEMIIEIANEKMLQLWGKDGNVLNKPVLVALPEIEGQGFDVLLDHVYTTGQRFVSEESAATLVRNGVSEDIYVKFVYEALFDEDGKITGVMAVADEVTRQVLSKNILKESEKRYRHLIENLPTAIYTCNAEGYITLYNQAAADLWGCEPLLEKDKWCGLRKIYKADGVTPISPLKNPMIRTLKQQPVSDKEIIVEKSEGERIYIQPHTVPFYDADGNLTGAINMLNNITEQKNAQKAIDENQLLFRTISNSAPVGLWMANSEGVCTFVNETWVNWTGIDLEQTLKEGWFGKLLEEDKPKVHKQFLEAFKKQTYFNAEFRLHRADGELRWCFTEGYPFNNTEGEFAGYTGSVTDITEKKIAQDELEEIIAERTKSLVHKNEELKKSEEKYHRMTEEVQDYAIILLDKEGRIMNWNNGAKKIKGYQESEIIGKNFRIFYLQEDLENYLPEKLIALAVETGRAENEGWRKRKDGTTFWGSIVITALHDDLGDIIGFSKVTRDLTERKKSEDTMKKYMSELEKQNIELEQFAYVSSHDLQEPLRKIRTFADLLENEVQEAGQRNYLKKINSSAERMSDLIKDLLNYSRLTKEGEEFVAVDLNQILANVKTDLEVVIAQKNAIILNDEFPMIKGIPLQFNQLFLNLLSNSLKFNTGQPIIKINVKSAPLYEIIASKLNPENSYLKITFADNGIGFEPEFSERIFTIFQRLNTRQKFSGTGIGLAMCKKIIDNHHGFIKAEGNIDQGATFIIYLPLT